MLKSDRIAGYVGILIAVFYIWRTSLIEEPFISDPVGPKVFPVVICVLLGLASLAMILKPDPEPHWPALPGLLEIAGGTIVMVGYAELLPTLGFVTATLIAAAYLAWRLGAALWRAVLAGLIISLGIYAVFHLILGLSLAEGPFGF